MTAVLVKGTELTEYPMLQTATLVKGMEPQVSGKGPARPAIFAKGTGSLFRTCCVSLPLFPHLICLGGIYLGLDPRTQCGEETFQLFTGSEQVEGVGTRNKDGHGGRGEDAEKRQKKTSSF